MISEMDRDKMRNSVVGMLKIGAKLNNDIRALNKEIAAINRQIGGL